MLESETSSPFEASSIPSSAQSAAAVWGVLQQGVPAPDFSPAISKNVMCCMEQPHLASAWWAADLVLTNLRVIIPSEASSVLHSQPFQANLVRGSHVKVFCSQFISACFLALDICAAGTIGLSSGLAWVSVSNLKTEGVLIFYAVGGEKEMLLGDALLEERVLGFLAA